jgi:hypothetical protein
MHVTGNLIFMELECKNFTCISQTFMLSYVICYRSMGDSEDHSPVPDRAPALTYYGSDRQHHCPFCRNNSPTEDIAIMGHCPWHSGTTQSEPSSSGLRYRRRHGFASGSDLPRWMLYFIISVDVFDYAGQCIWWVPMHDVCRLVWLNKCWYVCR